MPKRFEESILKSWDAQTREEKRVEYNPLLLPHPPHHPELIAGRKGLEGDGQGLKGLARKGFRWPSGARPTRPSQTVQVAGRIENETLRGAVCPNSVCGPRVQSTFHETVEELSVV